MSTESFFGDGYHENNTNISYIYHDDGYYGNMETTTLNRVQEAFFTYILPNVILWGTIGNILAILVFRKSKLGQFSVGFYMFMYGIVNNISLYYVYGLPWLCHVTELPDVQNISEYICRIWAFALRVIANSGIWLLVASLIDRYIFMFHPERVQAMCQVFMAKVAVIIVLIGLVVISVHAMWTYELVQNSCMPIDEDLHSIIWRWMSAFCYLIIPMIALIGLSFTLLLGIMGSRPRQPTTREPVDLTVLVLALSTVFLLLAMPATIVNVLDFTIPEEYYFDVEFMGKLNIAREISNILTCLNPVTLFVVCIISSKSFRQELKLMCCFCCAKARTRWGTNNSELKNADSRNSDVIVESQSNDTLL